MSVRLSVAKRPHVVVLAHIMVLVRVMKLVLVMGSVRVMVLAFVIARVSGSCLYATFA